MKAGSVKSGHERLCKSSASSAFGHRYLHTSHCRCCHQLQLCCSEQH
uniref:Uncharacterized protein n=1 Tax=Syphacia muris TaxID=451379 RepID=A0A0N5ABD9_9BILA